MNPSSEKLVSKFAFKFNLYRYTEEVNEASIRRLVGDYVAGKLPLESPPR